MLQHLTFICVAALALAACSHQNDSASSAPAGAATTSRAAAPATVATPPPASSGSAIAASGAPAAATSAAPASSDSTSQASTPAAPPAQPFVDNGKWVEGKNYFLIEPTQPKVSETSKIEVVEVFSWGCPACMQAHPLIDKLAASLPADAQMDYLPAAFRPDENWTLYQQAYYTAQSFGLAKKSYDAMFDATWKSGETASYDLAKNTLKSKENWPKIDDIATFYGKKYGIKPADFVATANSFSVKMKMKRADDLVKAYGVGGTPTIIIDGKYRFDGVSAGGYPQMVELAQWLVSKEAAGK